MKTRPSKAREARERAAEEVSRVVEDFRAFMDGSQGSWLVPASRIAERLDVKACLPRATDVRVQWDRAGLPVLTLGDVVECITQEGFNPQDQGDEVLTLLRVRYDGIPEPGEQAKGGELTYDYVQRARTNDLVASNIAMTLGSVAVIPDNLQHAVLSTEFTVMRLTSQEFNIWYIWGYLRSPEVRARLLSMSTGTNRTRVGWDVLKDIPIPQLPKETQDAIGEELRISVYSEMEADRRRSAASSRLHSLLDLDNPWAVQRLRAAKPPK